MRDVGSDDPDWILLLDVSVKRIVEKTVIARVHLAHDVGGLRDRIEHIALEAVQRLDRELDVAPRRVGGSILVHTRDVRALRLGRRLAGEDSEGLVEWTAERLAARRRQAIDRPLEMLECRGANRRIGARAIALGVWDDRDCGRTQAVVSDRPPNFTEMLGRPIENRQLDAVEAGALDVGEEREVLLGHVRRPQEHVESQKHLILPALSLRTAPNFSRGFARIACQLPTLVSAAKSAASANAIPAAAHTKGCL